MKAPKSIPVFNEGDRVRLSRSGKIWGQWLRVHWGNGSVSRGSRPNAFAKRQWTRSFRRCIGTVFDVVSMDGRHPDGFVGVRWEPSGRTAFYSPGELMKALPWERSKRAK